MKRVSATPGCPGCANPLLQARKFPHDPTTLSCAPKASNPSGRQLPLVSPPYSIATRRSHVSGTMGGLVASLRYPFISPIPLPVLAVLPQTAKLGFFSPASAPSLVAWARPGQSIQEARSPGHSSRPRPILAQLTSTS